MLMTRFLYLAVTLASVALNGAALALLSGNGGAGIAQAALIANIVIWPVALYVSYRIGQVTGVEYLRKARERAVAIKASQAARQAKAK